MFGTSRATAHLGKSAAAAPDGIPDASPTATIMSASPFSQPTSPVATYGPPLEHHRGPSFQVDKLCLTAGVRTEISAGPSRDSIAVEGAADDGSRSDLLRKPSLGIHIKRAWSVKDNTNGRTGGSQ
ncbi:hypothetical protein PG984_007813 [Apiospora sp. TS-2023a]